MSDGGSGGSTGLVKRRRSKKVGDAAFDGDHDNDGDDDADQDRKGTSTNTDFSWREKGVMLLGWEGTPRTLPRNTPSSFLDPPLKAWIGGSKQSESWAPILSESRDATVLVRFLHWAFGSRIHY